MRITKRQLKRIIREEYSRLKQRGLIKESFLGGRSLDGWLGQWYEEGGGYHKDADCFHILDACMSEGTIFPEDIQAVCDELNEMGISTLDELKIHWTQEPDPEGAWLEFYQQSDALQDLFWEVHDWRTMQRGSLKFPPAQGPDSRWCGGPAFVTAAWCLTQK